VMVGCQHIKGESGPGREDGCQDEGKLILYKHSCIIFFVPIVTRLRLRGAISPLLQYVFVAWYLGTGTSFLYLFPTQKNFR
jgi:hypothetical protein